MRRSIIDTEAELNARATSLAALLARGNCGSAFVQHHIKAMIVDAQQATARRAMENMAASTEREWTTAEPRPAGNGVGVQVLLPSNSL